MQKPTIKPLSPVQVAIYPVLKAMMHGNRREILHLRYGLYYRRKKHREALRKLARELASEAKVYEQLLTTALTRLGYAYTPGSDHESAAGGRKHRVQRVKFEVIKTSTEMIYYRILTRRKTLLGFRNALPYRVRVTDIVCDETLQELSYACERVVSAVSVDPRKGVWLRVHRLEGVGGLPVRVAFKDMLEHYPRNMDKATIILGIGEHRKVHNFDLAKHPHLLIGGPTGGGKSNMVNTIIASQMRLQDPAMFKFVLIDLKRMEFSFYEDSPHLYCPVIFEPAQAIEKLQELMLEVTRRADLLTGKAKELSAWNEKYPDKAMPRIVVVIDEFAELMLASGRKVAAQTETLVTRITNLGRAVGIHLIVCTQRPSVAVVSGAIRTNMAVTLCGKTPNKTQSAVIIGVGNAAELPDIPGRMIYGMGAQITAIQTPLILDEDVIESVHIARGKAAGVIRLEGHDPVVVPEGIAAFAARNGGLLDMRLLRLLRDYAVDNFSYKNAIDELARREVVEFAGNVYGIQHGKFGYKVYQRADDESAPETSPVLLLPARVASSEPESESTPAAPIDPFDQFIVGECVTYESARVLGKELYAAYVARCEANRLPALGKIAFNKRLADMGFTREKSTAGQMYWLGIELS